MLSIYAKTFMTATRTDQSDLWTPKRELPRHPHVQEPPARKSWVLQLLKF